MGEERYEELVAWCRPRSISIRGYHGTGLDGNNLKNFFKASKDLGLLLGVEKASPITDMLQKFDMLTKAAFSRELDKDWQKTAEAFNTSVWEMISYMKLEHKVDISVTWKVKSHTPGLCPFFI